MNYVRLVEVVQLPGAGGDYTLQECYVNPKWIKKVSVSLDSGRILEYANKRLGLDEKHSFSTLLFNDDKTITVVGEASHVQKLLSQRQILKG